MPGFSPRCPQCHRAWEERPQLIGKIANDFDDCAFRCHDCGLAFSNTINPKSRVLITRTPGLNVPAEVRVGLEAALAGAATVGNRTKKRKKFCSLASEDAVTWTVVHALLAARTVGALIGEPQLGEPEALLLWGHPVAGAAAAGVAARLVGISDELGENIVWRSEPDVIALWPRQLVFAEAKYRSGNDRQPNHKGYATYLRRPGLFTADGGAVQAEGSYQLTRNWVIGTRMAEDLSVPFRLVNVGPSTIGTRAAEFSVLLAQTAARRFEHRRWCDVLACATAAPSWLDDYAESRELYSS